MQLLQPLAVQNVTLSTRNVLDVTCVDQLNVKPTTLKDFKDWNPLNAGGFHGELGDVAVN